MGDFSECSHVCGGGIRTRRVRCIQILSRNGDAASTLILPALQCAGKMPTDREPCGIVDCSPTWRVSDEWSQCSSSCDAGEQHRRVVCEQRDAFGNLKIFDPPTPCNFAQRPPSTQLCNLGSCDSSSNRPTSLHFKQNTLEEDYDDEESRSTQNLQSSQRDYDQGNTVTLNVDLVSLAHPNHRKLTLNVGGFANLYEGTSIKVKCPTREFNRQRIHWTKDGQRIENNAHMKVSSNGALRIFHARMEDAGLYACFANGVRGNVTIRFKQHHEKERNNKTANAKSKLPRPPLNKQLVQVCRLSVCKQTHFIFFQQIRASLEKLGQIATLQTLSQLSEKELTQLRVNYAFGNWSKCSQLECGKLDGVQVRMLKCELHLSKKSKKTINSVVYVDEEICEAFAVDHRPPATRSCTNENCPQWDASDWSEVLHNSH